MKKRMNRLISLQTIRAIVAGETWGRKKVIEHYSGEIDCLCMKAENRSDGSIKKIVDEICGKLLRKVGSVFTTVQGRAINGRILLHK